MTDQQAPQESTGTDKRQDNVLWLQLWKDQRTDFHQQQVSPLLPRFWNNQTVAKNARVLVPLCGKSQDMLWLAARGHRVIGVELSPLAVKAFFSENNLKVKKSRVGNFTCWQSGLITIWCGDFFSLQKHQLGKVDIVFDRAALTALSGAIRQQYIGQLCQLIGINCQIFLLTVEDIDNHSQQSPDMIDSEITALYAGQFDISLMHTESACVPETHPQTAGFHTESKVYRLTYKPVPA
ncbi:thiopurine S-methyltransferase [Amphritea atlantica]|uniref:Thiopurine S-methyltransferase n=1 Tax=Amphritea atlantica TaxID=355243 RepID=A0A1H9HF71_9GAMM|nr:thiopurine S-methyltransferase [Amphritea atlantica]SEQ60947.1 thiopurine S-methyltransferase [Amphritea atlantica]